LKEQNETKLIENIYGKNFTPLKSKGPLSLPSGGMDHQLCFALSTTGSLSFWM